MSRSYRKPYWNPIAPGNPKRQANKTVRQTRDIADGKAYRKVFCSWSIHDFGFYHPQYPELYRK